MNKRSALAIAGTLGHPAKMPGTAYGIPANRCKVGGMLAQTPGTVCHGCYALKGNYQFPSVKTAQERRLESLAHPQWVDAMVTLLLDAHPTGGHHRWHDSGDVQSLEHLDRIVTVCRATPLIQHWLPTKEIIVVAQWIRRHGAFPDNLTVRLSSPRVDQGPLTGHAVGVQTSTVHEHGAPHGHVCPAPTTGGKCGDCRACWSRDVPNVSYHKH